MTTHFAFIYRKTHRLNPFFSCRHKAVPETARSPFLSLRRSQPPLSSASRFALLPGQRSSRHSRRYPTNRVLSISPSPCTFPSRRKNLTGSTQGRAQGPAWRVGRPQAVGTFPFPTDRSGRFQTAPRLPMNKRPPHGNKRRRRAALTSSSALHACDILAIFSAPRRS